MALHFLRPYWFLAIIPTLWLCWYLTKINLADNWRRFCDEHLLSQLLVLPEKKLTLPIVLLALGSLLTIISLAGPSFQQENQPIYRSMLGRILVLNLSPSMSDSVMTTKKIDRARFKLLDYLNREKEGLTGLLVYTDEAYTISPLTEDNHTIANFVPSLDPSIMPTYNDDTAVGLQHAEKLFKQAGLSQGNIILITDKITEFSKTQKVAQSLLEEGYHTYVYDLSHSSISNPEMQKLVNVGGGKVISLTPNNHDIDELISTTTARSLVPPVKKTQEKGMIWKDNGRIFVFFILPLALLAFRRGYV